MELIDIKSQNLPELKATIEKLGEKAFRAKQLYQWMRIFYCQIKEENRMELIDIKSQNLPELKATIEKLGEKAFRAKQLYQWMHQKLADDFQDMTNLSVNLREKLEKHCVLTRLKALEVQTSKLDGTQKYLFALADGNVVESVLMKYKHGNSVCISSQVGCKMGCRFCASTIGGWTRNLTTSEMLDQVYQIQKLSKERVSNVVVMGTGEPLDNYENLLRFLHMLSDENGLHISQRNITVSTCGIVPRIYDLAEENLQITLAISLHASNQEKPVELCQGFMTWQKKICRLHWPFLFMLPIRKKEQNSCLLPMHIPLPRCWMPVSITLKKQGGELLLNTVW